MFINPILSVWANEDIINFLVDTYNLTPISNLIEDIEKKIRSGEYGRY